MAPFIETENEPQKNRITALFPQKMRCCANCKFKRQNLANQFKPTFDGDAVATVRLLENSFNNSVYS